MDHSYRNAQGGNDFGQPNGRYRGPGRGIPQEGNGAADQPVATADSPTRIVCFIDDLFFLAKIQETARKLGVKVEFAKAEKETIDRLTSETEEKPSLIIFDLNNANAKPLVTIPKLKNKLKKQTSIVGFLSHLQGDLKVKAQEAGCDMVVPRSAFSQNLPALLRRHSSDLHDGAEA
jgi:PleD family two-component response regulator